MEIAISGANGLIGSALTKSLQEDGHRTVALVRRDVIAGQDEIRWIPSKAQIDAPSLEGFDAVVHLAGAGIGEKRWNTAYKNLLETSRTQPTALLADTLAGAAKKPKVFLSASAIGFYGNRPDETLTEESKPGDNFLASLTQRWEEAAQSAIDAGIRTAFLRTGIVLSPTGGALAKMLPLFKIGLGGKFGSGQQVMSWVSIQDQVAAIRWLLENKISGPVNITAPQPVTNKEFTKSLGQALGRPSFLPVPAFGPKLLLGSEMAQALLFDSQKVLPQVLIDSGYQHEHETLEEAFAALL